MYYSHTVLNKIILSHNNDQEITNQCTLRKLGAKNRTKYIDDGVSENLSIEGTSV